jgi:hypothetical protein
MSMMAEASLLRPAPNPPAHRTPRTGLASSLSRMEIEKQSYRPMLVERLQNRSSVQALDAFLISRSGDLGGTL